MNASELAEGLHREVGAVCARRAKALRSTQPELAAELSRFAYLHQHAAKKVGARREEDAYAGNK